MKPPSEATNVFAVKILGGGGRGGGGGTLNPLPPLKACFRKRIPMHTRTKAVTPLKLTFIGLSIQIFPLPTFTRILPNP